MEFNFPTTPQEAGTGKLVSFLSVRTGAGASTLACMTAITSAQYYQTSLIDLTAESKVRSYLGYQDEVTAVSILDINSVATPEGVFAASEEHHLGMKVFPGIPHKILDASQLDTKLMLKATTYLKQASPLTIAVVNNLWQFGWIPVMLSDIICVIVKPDRTCQDGFRETMAFLNRLDCADRSVIVLNQQNYPGCLEPKGAIKWFSPDVVIDYNKNITRDCNRRELKPDLKIRNELLKIIKGGETNA